MDQMVNGEAKATIEVRAVSAKASEIIPAQKRLAKKVLDIALTPQPADISGLPQITTPATAKSAVDIFLSSAKLDIAPGKNRLIVNIETNGFKPWEKRIIAIGIQDPELPDEQPIILMDDSEEKMIKDLFRIIKDGSYNELVGYGLSFDYRFLLIESMKFGISAKEFFDMTLYDLMQSMAQGKMSFVYKAQNPPSLSDISDYFWGFPKPFSDLDMIKYWALGRSDKVVEFASGQITRILLLYYLFRNITETSIDANVSQSPGFVAERQLSDNPGTASLLTIPEANTPSVLRQTCENCLSEFNNLSSDQLENCTVCNQPLQPGT